MHRQTWQMASIWFEVGDPGSRKDIVLTGLAWQGSASSLSPPQPLLQLR